jgi:microfibrillar-associated protein 1
MASIQRNQAPRLARPAARYWKGKAPKGIAEVQSDSDVEEEGLQEGIDEGVEELEGTDEGIESFGFKKEGDLLRPKGMNITLKDVSVSEEGKVIIAGREEFAGNLKLLNIRTFSD